MVYESLSSIILLVIAAILVLAWLPGRTVRGMKRASEHRQDKLSTSLHMVGGQDGMRFGDTGSRTVKGLVMQQKQQDKASQDEARRIRRVRQMRREAIRRRRILVVSLLAVTVLVAGFSFPMEYSFWFMLIPLALTILVLAAGARASAQARAWEVRLARHRARQRRQRAASLTAGVGRSGGKFAVGANDARRAAEAPAEPATDVLNQQEIDRTIAQAREEKRVAMDARHRRAAADKAAKTKTGADGEAKGVKTSSQDPKSVGHAKRSTVKNTAVTSARNASRSARTGTEQKSGQGTEAGKPIQNKGRTGTAIPEGKRPESRSKLAAPAVRVEPEQGEDATHELERISPSPALDAFEMAASQDLISFSLGSPRNGVTLKSEGPQSLEIKSTRQVSKAEPVKTDSARGTRVDRPRATADQGQTDSSGKDRGDRPSDFHQREIKADVEAPKQSSDSLAIGVEAILARRQPSKQS